MMTSRCIEQDDSKTHVLHEVHTVADGLTHRITLSAVCPMTAVEIAREIPLEHWEVDNITSVRRNVIEENAMLIESIKNAVKNLNKFEVSGIKTEDRQVLVFVAKQSLIYALEQTNDYLKHLEEKHNASNIQE
jgi:hypothetical protein